MTRVYAGELATAEPELLKAIALKRKVDGGDSADVAESMNTLAELYARRGELVKAIDMTDQARAIYDREHGPDGIMSGRGYNNRCEYLNSLGRYGRRSAPAGRRSRSGRQSSERITSGSATR